MKCVERNEKVFERNLLRYGTILSDEEISGDNYVRIRKIVIDGKKYLHYMVNGEVKDVVYLEEVKTYRFYFSRYQKELHQIFDNMIDELDMLLKKGEIPPSAPGSGKSILPRYTRKKSYVKLADGQTVEFTQICTEKGEKCNFKDAALVAEIIGTEEEISQRICRG